jgi:hypothetical protein
MEKTVSVYSLYMVTEDLELEIHSAFVLHLRRVPEKVGVNQKSIHQK